MTDIQSIPILLSPDIAQTREFAQSLGFEVEVFGDTYAIVHGQGIEIHYSHTTRPEVCSETSCYIRGGGILALHPMLRAKAPEQVSEIYHREWGMTEFYLHDPHGNLWKFGMSSDELPADFTLNKEA